MRTSDIHRLWGFADVTQLYEDNVIVGMGAVYFNRDATFVMVVPSIVSMLWSARNL